MTLEELSKEQWDDCLIIFDTSAICKMYDMTDQTKKTMVEILDYLKDRIWIPGHVVFEYHKNRIKVIHNPSKEKYTVPDYFSNLILKEKGKSFIKSLENDKDYHPFISDGAFEKANVALEEAIKNLAEVKTILKKEFDKRKKEIERLVVNDIILNSISTLPHGEDLSFSQMQAICEEGEFRYRNSIPPGYMDGKEINGRKKLGFDAYGDLFVWKQILTHVKSHKKDVIFICNDEKEDWWENFKKHTLRNELLKEFEEASDHTVFGTSLEGFISELVNRYKDDTGLPFYEGLEAVKDVLEYYSHFTSPGMTKDDVYAFLKCKNCGHTMRVVLKDVDFDWEEDSWDERERGPEYGYNANIHFECDDCLEDMELSFSLTEYPVGKIEEIRLNSKQCTIENDPNWMRVIEPTIDKHYEECLYCGRRVRSLTYDMCDLCLDEFNRKIEKD